MKKIALEMQMLIKKKFCVHLYNHQNFSTQATSYCKKYLYNGEYWKLLKHLDGY